MNPAPFDAVARDYDRAFTGTAVGRLQRQVVWEALQKIVAGKSLRVLELNCGTGEDAVWLARQGCRVLATDISAEMVACTLEKARQAGVDLETRVCGFADLGGLSDGNFDLIFSNFGGLNCLSPADLPLLGKALAQKLCPGGQFVAVIMGRFCWWETVYFLAKGRWREAFRRFGGGPVSARLDAHTAVETWYYGAGEMMALLGPAGFAKRSFALQAVGFWVPPSYLNPFFAKRPRLLRGLCWLEKRCRGRAWAWGADHFLVCCRAR